MSYSIDGATGDVIISGFEQGIANDPYDGISDMRNVNIISVPKEASVNFSTSQISPTAITGTVVSADAGGDTVTVSVNTLANKMAIVFAGGSLPAGITAGTLYYIDNVGNPDIFSFQIFTDYNRTALVNITSTGTGTFAIVVPTSLPKYFTFDSQNSIYYMIDASGKVWSNYYTDGNGNWTYTGNLTNNHSNGNGLVSYQNSNTTNGGNVSSANAGTDVVTYNTAVGLQDGMALVFAGGGLAGSGIIAGTTYYIGAVTATTFKLYTDPSLDISFLLDILGNAVGTFTNQSTGYVFAFSNSSIDIFNVNTGVWSYQWSPSIGTIGVYSADPVALLKTPNATNNNHEAIVAPDNKVYFTDANYIGRWYQSNPNVPFLPNQITTYVFDQTAVLPFIDVAQCLAPLGNNLLIGGQKNVAYPWDTFSPLPSYPILIAEHNIQKMVTVNTNTFIFVGNRGRIYVTNGSQVSLYKKIPDHISGTVEPYFIWGGATSNKNQLYFSARVTTNAGVANNNYGGVWAIDMDTKAIRLVNKLSYGSYAGYASALTPNFSSAPAGTGLYIGWFNGTATYGIDQTSSNPYTNGESTVDSDLIPIGTFLKPTNNGRVEFKLSVPLVLGENVQLWYRQQFNQSFTQIGSSVLYNTNGSGTTYSHAFQKVPFKNSQWIQIRAVLTSTTSSPSYCRLTSMTLGN